MCSESTAESEPSYLTVAQLAQRLQVSVSTIYGWVDRDYIPFLMAGDLVRFDPAAIHKWMLAEADRKREKKRELREVRVKVACCWRLQPERSNRMTIRKRGTRYHYDFMVRRQRYRGTLPRGSDEGRSRTSRDKDQN